TYVGISGVTGTSLTVNWTDNATNESGYMVYRVSPGLSTLVAGCQTNVPGLTSCTDSGLAPGTYYAYQVWAWNAAGSAYPGTYIAGYTTSGAPMAPTVTSAAGVSTTSIRITWLDNSGNETGFNIYRWSGGAGTLAGTVGAGTTFFVDQGLQAGTN